MSHSLHASTAADSACESLSEASCQSAPWRARLAALGADAEQLDRRGFLTQSMLAAATLALVACGGDITGISSPTTVAASIRVADYSALSAVGGVALVSLNGAQLAIVRTGQDSFVALSRACPHAGGTIGTTSTGFRCPRHGATFNSVGTWTGGQRTSSMRSYATTYDATAGTLVIG